VHDWIEGVDGEREVDVAPLDHLPQSRGKSRPVSEHLYELEPEGVRVEYEVAKTRMEGWFAADELEVPATKNMSLRNRLLPVVEAHCLNEGNVRT